MNRKKKEAEATLLNAATHRSSRPDAVATIRHALAQAHKGEGRPVDEVFDELEHEDAG